MPQHWGISWYFVTYAVMQLLGKRNYVRIFSCQLGFPVEVCCIFFHLKWSVLIGRALIAVRGRHGIISYYRSNEQILGKHLIGREQFHHQGALRVKCVDGSDGSRAVT